MDEPSNQYSSSSHLVSTFTASSPPASHPPIHFSTPSPTFPPLRIPFTPLQLVIIALIFAVLSLMTVAGNLFVIAAFRTEPSLRQPHNYFLLSLAVADLAVGAVSLPFFGTYVIYGYRWPMGSLACDMWLALDYTMSSASAASLLLISLDRYYSIISPLAYRSLRTRKRVCIVITAAWITSGLVWCPGIFGYPYIYGSRIVPYDDCYIQFLKTNSFLTVITALFAFFIPVCIMVVLYFRIWRVTEKRKKDLKVLMAIRPTDCGSGQHSKRLRDSKSLKKTQYFKLNCLKLRQTLKNRAKTNRKINRKGLKTCENDQHLEIQEVEDRSTGLCEVQSQQESGGFDLRPEPTSNLKKHRGLKNLQEAFNCLKLSQGLKNSKINKSTKTFPTAEDLKVKTSELMELNFQKQPEDRKFEVKSKPKREIKRLKNVKDLEKNNPKTSFNCLNLRQGLTRRKMFKQSIRDFPNPKTKGFELYGTDFREVKGKSENVKLKTKPGVNIKAEESDEVNFRAQKQKLKFNYLTNTKMNETSLKDVGSTESNEFEERVIDFVEDATAMSTELPKLKTNLPQESRRLGELKKDSQDETLNNIELSGCFKYEGQRNKKDLKPSDVLDIKATEGIRETYGHFNSIFKSGNTEMYTVEYDEDVKSFRPSLKISDDNLGATETTETMNINSTTRNNDPLEQMNGDVIATEDKQVIMVSVVTNDPVKDFMLDKRTRKTIRNKDETTRNPEDDTTESQTTDNNVSPSTSPTALTKHIYSSNVNDTANKEDIACLRSRVNGSLTPDYSDNNIRTCITASTGKDNRKYNNVITPSNCSAAANNTWNLHTKGNDDDHDMKSAQQTKTENTNEDTKQKHYNKYNPQTKSIINTTKSAATTTHNNNHKNKQQTTNHIIHNKKHTKSTKKDRRKKRPINKRIQHRSLPSIAKPSQFPQNRCFEEQGDVYTILINIPRGERMGRPSIRLVGGSFDQWHRSVDGCENLNLKGGNNNEFRNMTINEWEESDFESESESEMIEVCEEEEEVGNNVSKNECENMNINEWVESEEEVVEIGEWEEKNDNDDENMEIVGLSRISLEPKVLPGVARKPIEIDASNNYHHHDNNTDDEQYEGVVTSLRETSDITTGTGTGSDTIETEPWTEEVTPNTTNERGQKWRKGHSTHRRIRIPDRKAAKTLSAILLVFIVTWLPYNVLALLQAFCDNCVNETLYAIGYWLCYLNSTINPLCYALCNANFRKAFLRIVNCQRRQYQLQPGAYAHRGLHTRGHLPV